MTSETSLSNNQMAILAAQLSITKAEMLGMNIMTFHYEISVPSRRQY